MEQYHRKLINDNLVNLSYNTINTESIVNKLLERGVINDWMKNHILKPTAESERNLKLYSVIQGRGPNAFTDLCIILDDTLNKSALGILTRNNREIVPSSNHASEYGSDNYFISETGNLDDDETYVKIHPERLRMDINEENLPTGAYPMGSNPKGHALILNMNKIRNYDDRIGSNVDVKNLQKLFECLGYVVQSKVDLTQKEFIKTIEEFTRKCHCERTDSIVVFIMSHGEAGENASRSSDILTTEGNKINTDWIIEQFGPEKISINIPKLFFIQACRGKNLDLGWRSFDNGNGRVQNDSTTTSNNNHHSVETIPNRRYENVFIAHATIPGYGAKRDQIDGSWFVQKLCKVIRGNAWKFDLDSMMKMVDMEIRNLNSIQHGFQTVEWTYRGFNKKFYFNPGLYNDSSDNDPPTTISIHPVDT